MVSFRRPFHFYDGFLGSGRAARTFTLPAFVRHDAALEPRLAKFGSWMRDHLNGFFNFRGAVKLPQIREEAAAIKEQLWHTQALLGLLQDRRTRSDLKNGKIPTLVRFERQPARTLHERIVQNVPLFGVSAASLISMGVPLPWNMIGGGLATAVREYSENFKSHREFENNLRLEFKKTGRDPDTYLKLYHHLDFIIPYPLDDQRNSLPLAHRLSNYKQLKAFQAKLEEVQHFASAYLEGLSVLQRDANSGRKRMDVVDGAVQTMLAHVRLSKEAAELKPGPQGTDEPDPSLERVRESDLVKAAEQRVRDALLEIQDAPVFPMTSARKKPKK